MIDFKKTDEYIELYGYRIYKADGKVFNTKTYKYISRNKVCPNTVPILIGKYHTMTINASMLLLVAYDKLPNELIPYADKLCIFPIDGDIDNLGVDNLDYYIPMKYRNELLSIPDDKFKLRASGRTSREYYVMDAAYADSGMFKTYDITGAAEALGVTKSTIRSKANKPNMYDRYVYRKSDKRKFYVTTDISNILEY